MDLTPNTWSDFKNIVQSKGLTYQYYSQTPNYFIWAFEESATYNYTIWKSGYEPNAANIGQITYDRLDFEQNILPIVNLQSQKVTYAASVTGLVAAASATDIFEIDGSANKIIEITQIAVSGTATAAATVDLQIIKRQSLNSGGTFTSPTIVAYLSKPISITPTYILKVPNSDSIIGLGSSPTATPPTYSQTLHTANAPNISQATLKSYTANPTLGSSLGVIRTVKFAVVASGTFQTPPVIFNFTTPNTQPLTLLGSHESICVNLNSTTLTGSSIDIFIEWNER